MENNTPSTNHKKSEIEPYLKGIFETYCLWKSLPSIFKNPPAPKGGGLSPSAREFAEGMGIDDDEILELVQIRTQTQFCEKYGVSKDTLSKWNKTVASRSGANELRQWARGLSKNVLVSLYNTAVRKGSSFEVKLWFQLVEEWEEKSQIKGGGIGDVTFNIIVKKNGDQPRTIGETAPSLGSTTQ